VQRLNIVAGVILWALSCVSSARAQELSLWSPGIVPVSPELRVAQPVAPLRPGTLQDPPRRSRVRNAVVGGTIGALSGVVLCTLISTLLVNSERPGVTMCTTRGNLIFGGGGFLLGATIGAVSK